MAVRDSNPLRLCAIAPSRGNGSRLDDRLPLRMHSGANFAPLILRPARIPVTFLFRETAPNDGIWKGITESGKPCTLLLSPLCRFGSHPGLATQVSSWRGHPIVPRGRGRGTGRAASADAGVAGAGSARGKLQLSLSGTRLRSTGIHRKPFGGVPHTG